MGLDHWGNMSTPCPLTVPGREKSDSSKTLCFYWIQTPHQNDLYCYKQSLVRIRFYLLAQLDRWGKEHPDTLGLGSLRLKHLTLCPDLFLFIQLCPAYMYAGMYVHMYMHIYTYMYEENVYIYVYINVYLCVCVFIYNGQRALLSGSYIPLLIWAG